MFGLAILGLLLGVLADAIFNWSGWTAVLVGLIAGIILGYVWKARIYEPISLEGLSATEWVIWLILSILITPIITGTVGYYMYGHKNKYPTKWKRVNIIILIGLIVYLAYFVLRG